MPIYTNGLTRKRYYYSRLTASQRYVYDSICLGLQAYSEHIELPYVAVHYASSIFENVLYDNPLIFYTKSFSLNSNAHKQKCFLKPNYFYSSNEILRLEHAVLEHLRLFDPAKTYTELNKELFVHDYCLHNLRYSIEFGVESHTILGPILHRAAVCEGITKFVKLALDYLDVSNLLVYGKAHNPQSGADENHVWNIVKLSGDCFHLDVTLDLTLMHQKKRYDYFNISDVAIKKDHEFAKFVPICITEGKDYYSQNGLVANSPSELKRLLAAEITKGNNTVIVKINNITEPADIVNKVTNIAAEVYGNICNRSVNVEVRYNLTQLVFEVICL